MRNGKKGHGLFDGLNGVYDCVRVHMCELGGGWWVVVVVGGHPFQNKSRVLKCGWGVTVISGPCFKNMSASVI